MFGFFVFLVCTFSTELVHLCLLFYDCCKILNEFGPLSSEKNSYKNLIKISHNSISSGATGPISDAIHSF